MSNLDNEILEEINMKTHRYKYLKIFSVKTGQLEELKQLDISWIERVCKSEGYDPREYLDYYLERAI